MAVSRFLIAGQVSSAGFWKRWFAKRAESVEFRRCIRVVRVWRYDEMIPALASSDQFAPTIRARSEFAILWMGRSLDRNESAFFRADVKGGRWALAPNPIFNYRNQK